jgi:hypothetical protein
MFGTASAAGPEWTATLAGPNVIPPGICSVNWELQGGAGGGEGAGLVGRLVVNTPVTAGDSFTLFPGSAGEAAEGAAGGLGGINDSSATSEDGEDGDTATDGTGGNGGGAASTVYTAGETPTLFLSAFGGDGAAGAEADSTPVPGGQGGGGNVNSAGSGVTLTAEQEAGTASGSGDGTITGTGVACDVPDAPTGLTVVPGDGQLAVSFTPAADAGDEMSDVTGWLISLDGGQTVHDYLTPEELTDTDGVLSIVVGALQNGTAYTVAVSPSSAAGDGAWAIADPQTPAPPAVPAAPTGVSVVPQNGSLKVTLTPGVDEERPEATSFEYNLDGGPWKTLVGSLNDGAYAGTIAELANGTIYQVRVRGINGSLQGDPSGEVSGQPQDAPSAPTDVAVASGDGALGITFKPGADPGAAMADPTGWEISTDNGANFHALNVTDSAGLLGGSRTGLSNGTTYQVVLRATSLVGHGSPSAAKPGTPAAAIVTPPNPPVENEQKAPASPSLHNPQGIDKGIEFTIIDVPTSISGGPAPTGYQYRTDNGAWKSLTTSSRNGSLIGTVSGLTNGTTYTVEVRAIAGTTGELHSLTNKVTATPRYSVPAPQDLKVSVLPGSIRATWAAPANAVGLTGYEVRAYAEDEEGWVGCATGPADRSCVLPVAAGKTYTVVVISVGADGLGHAVYTETAVVPAVVKPAAVPTKDDGDIRTANGPIERTTPGEKVTLIGTGFLPGSTIELIVYSTPISLGSITAGPDGTFTAEVTIPAGLAAGTHHLVATGVDQNGNVRNLVIEVAVDAAGAGTVQNVRERGLASTGASIALPVGGGLLALLAGGGLLVASRRRGTV